MTYQTSAGTRVIELTPIGRVFLLKGVNSITLEACMGGGKNPFSLTKNQYNVSSAYTGTVATSVN